MIAWPKNIRVRELAESEPVETPLAAAAQPEPDRSPAIEVDGASPPDEAGPALPSAADPIAPRRARAYSAGLLLALGVSALAHTGVLAFLVEQITRPGIEAETDAVSVEIVLEEPPSPDAGSQAASAQPEVPSGEADEPEVVENKPDQPSGDEPPRPQPTEIPAPQAPDGTASNPPVEQTEEAAEVPEPTPPSQEPNRPAEDPHPAELKRSGPERPQADARSKEPERETMEEDAVASVTLPQDDVPLPTPRPEPPEAKRTAASQKSVKRQAGPETSRRQAEEPEGPRPSRQAATAARSAERNAERTRQSAGGQKGGAAAGDTRAYARRLVGHVERHKRFPREAARQGIAGTARLAVTIDRRGRLAGARLAKSSGHALLDEEALATARRAAPYPRPPEGLGGGSITFTVDLRFSG